ncbi:hypothetical protein [Thalassospira xiamenensis]|uniref:hypothetical protein n=1 Tax=Thalassospira xiamenensis TaxID=220697 RepID=UPI0011BE13EA|nr:hypothetical protein [Thalassospira xiamenensis]
MNVSRPIMWPIASLAIAVMASGFSQTAQAQPTLTATPDETGVTIGLPKIDGSPNSLVPGILPPASPGGMRNYFSTRGNRGIVLGHPASDSEGDQSLFWLEMDSQPTSSNGIAAQIGIGFAPRPDLGFAFGPVFELNGPIGQSASIGSGNDYDVTPTHRPSGVYSQNFSSNPAGTDDAGIAASLSYMPFQDIWIGLHGRVTSDLSSGPNAAEPDRFDAMLGLTAGYRLEF